jgi:hypothetical protein
MNIVLEFVLRVFIGAIWFAALVFTTILLAPAHFMILLSQALLQKTSMKSQWIW